MRNAVPAGARRSSTRHGLLAVLFAFNFTEHASPSIPLEALQSRDEKVAVPPLVGALLKNEQDVTLFEKLVFMQRHNR